MLPLLLAATIATGQGQSRYVDTDHDGLLDYWETEGFGPIDPKVHKLDPKRSDVIIVFRIRSTMTQAKIQPTIDRMKKFYASMPFKNPDGSTGLNMIAVVPPPMPKETDGKGYIELYEQGMPVEWRGLAHGILVDDSPGGGGQCNRPDWCGTGYNWMTMLHEVGHQFGLPHDPMGASTGSPFHRSLMNYDYSYQLNGNGENIIFSDGKFEPMRMKETDLRETVPFAAADLAFLTNRPYYFKIKDLGGEKSAIDWNRNGVFSETGVRADVNDGYAVALRSAVKLERTAGQPAMAAVGQTLAVVYPDLPDAEYKDYAGASLSAEKPGRMRLLLVNGSQPGKPMDLIEKGVTSDPSAAAHRGSLWASASVNGGIALVETRLNGAKTEIVGHVDWNDAQGVPTVVSTPSGLWVALWDGASKGIKLRRVDGGSTEWQTVPGLTSQHALGATWNAKRKRLAIASTEKQNNFDGRIRITHLAWYGKVWTVDGEPLWVGGEKGDARTSGRPIPLLDDTKDGGPNGAYTVYVKGQYPDIAQPGVNYSCRQIADPSHSGGWRIKMMGNEWALSRSVCAAAPFKGDTAYIYRWSWGDDSHRMLLTLKSSGVEDAWLTDFDEVGYIFKTGLAQSLRSVQLEQWKRR